MVRKSSFQKVNAGNFRFSAISAQIVCSVSSYGLLFTSDYRHGYKCLLIASRKEPQEVQMPWKWPWTTFLSITNHFGPLSIDFEKVDFKTIWWKFWLTGKNKTIGESKDLRKDFEGISQVTVWSLQRRFQRIISSVISLHDSTERTTPTFVLTVVSG